MLLQRLQLSFCLIRLKAVEETLFEEFQNGLHGGHLGYLNGTILAILNLHVATMPPTEFQLNPTHVSGQDVEKLMTDKQPMDNRPRHKLS